MKAKISSAKEARFLQNNYKLNYTYFFQISLRILDGLRLVYNFQPAGFYLL